MSEVPGDPSATPSPAPAQAPAAPPAAPAETRPPREASVRALLEAGAHFGHQTRRWNPQMRRFIYGERNGIHIIDLDQTLPRLEAGLEFLRETVARGGKVLFVATKRQAQAPVRLEAERCNQYYVNNRWLGGMLTNFRTVRRSIERFKEMLAILDDEEKANELPKKELSALNREVTKYRKSLDGIKEMTRLPDAMFVVDLNKEHIAVAEAQRLGIPIVAIVDTNCSPEGIDLPIPANDDAIRAIQLYCELAADACLEGAEIFNERVQSQETEAPRSAEAAPTGGRRVVDIKPPPAQTRRGRQPGGTHPAAPRRRAAGPRQDEAKEQPEKEQPEAGAAEGGSGTGETPTTE
jgi:small subunit ribosomal protein S2